MKRRFEEMEKPFRVDVGFVRGRVGDLGGLGGLGGRGGRACVSEIRCVFAGFMWGLGV